MEALEAAVEIVRALAWPVAVLIVVFVLRTHLIALIPKMEELTAGPSGISAKFRQDAAAVGQMAAEANQTLPPSQEDAARESAWGELEEVGKTQPIAAVIAAWFEVEQAAIAVAESLNLDRRNTRPITSPKIVADQLVRQELIAPEFSRLAAELSSLRNRAVHENPKSVDPGSAQFFVAGSQSLLSAFRTVLGRSTNASA